MEIKCIINKMKDIYSALIDFIEADSDCEDKFKKLNRTIEEHEIFKNKEENRLLFQLTLKIGENYQRSSDFFDKLATIFQYIIKDAPSPISYFIPEYTEYNKRILFLLLKNKLLKPDDAFIEKYLQSKHVNYPFSMKNLSKYQSYYYYLYPTLKEYLNEKKQKEIESEIQELFDIGDISSFCNNCEIGENESYICTLIRTDSVEDFISYVNRTNLSLLTKITPTIFETNSFLIDKTPTLIEYAAFFGSIQIIQYLKYNKVPLKFSLWPYAIHSNNAELIHFLEENEVKPEKTYYKKESYDDALKESIRCHHNAISNYIIDNFYEAIQKNNEKYFYDNFNESIFDSLNFIFFPCEIDHIICRPRNEKGFKLCQLCFSLTTITIPSSVTKIGENAFLRCSLLKNIIIPSSVTKIGNYAFQECTSLTHITIPSSVTSVGKYVFNGIKTLEINGSIQHIPNNLFFECSLTQITILSSITSIGEYSFRGCESLTQISIPSSVTSIRNYAFSGCSSLAQITIPSSVTTIGDSVFYKCSSLTNVSFEIPSSLTSIGNNAFECCSSLTKIKIPSSVTSFGNYTFSKCLSLAEISFEIPSSLTSFGKSSFIDCKSLTEITIPSSVTSIGVNSFRRCSLLERVLIPSSIISIGDHAFRSCILLTQITIPSSVISIGPSAFSGCSSLKQITIPSSITSIGASAFSRCSSLTQITIPSSLEPELIGLNAQTIIYRI